MVGGLPMMDPSWYLYAGIFVGPFVQEDAAVIAAATLSASDSQHFPLVTDKVMAMRGRVERNAVSTLLAARFLPLARVPAYIACGYFKMNYLKFCAIIFGTALLYCIVIFALIHSLGEIFGDEMNAILGIIACVAIFLTISVLGIGRWLSRRQTDQDASEDL